MGAPLKDVPLILFRITNTVIERNERVTFERLCSTGIKFLCTNI